MGLEKEGLETIRELRRDNPDVKIIAMSGGGRMGPQNYIEVARVLGAQQAFAKPLDRKKFLAAVRQYGRHHGALASVLGVSVLVQILRIAQTWCLGLALGLGIGGLWYFAFVPIIVMVMLLLASLVSWTIKILSDLPCSS